MPLFIKEHKSILYIHVPKTGGRSILEIFVRNGFTAGLLDAEGGRNSLNYFRKCSPQHLHGRLLQENLHLERIDLVFMTVRHPLARFKSEFIWHNRNPEDDIEQWAARVLDSYEDDRFVFDNHIRPQVEFWVPGAHVFRQEDDFGVDWVKNLEALLDLELPIKSVDRFHSSQELVDAPSDTIPLSPSLRARLDAFYAADFKKFGYSAKDP